MRKYLLLASLAVVVIAGSLIVFQQVKAQQAPTSAPTLVVTPAYGPLAKNTNLVILGTGYKPAQELNILFYDGFGSIGALEETVKADDKGNFVSSWTLGDYSRGGILVEGVTNIMTADESFNIIATAAVALADTGRDWARWPAWAKGAFPKPKPKEAATPKPAATGTPKPAASPTAAAEPKPKS
ncbi:MAG: hypothetical protein HY673_10905 [Chloroflexi bacterium]|nr:hypothetical protein [Chloroflexota bacterium]